MRIFVLLFALCLPASLALRPTPAQAAPLPSADALLDAIDKNMVFDTRTSDLRMTVTKNGRVKTYAIRSFGRGADEAALEYLEPARDKGTKMLKKGGELWMYLPSIEKTQKISGHMLRQGMMGSDFSYEDMMESTALRQKYTATVTGEQVVNGRPCYVLELKSKSPDVSYPRRVSFVDKELAIPLRQDLYALSGMLLKTWRMEEIQDFSGRKFPTKMIIENAVEKGSITEVTFSNMKFSVALQEEVFSQRWLER
jgi:outer membrane lipoprotein-sorting protein